MSTFELIAPDAIGLIEGLTLSSLGGVPPGGFALAGLAASAATTVTLSGGYGFSASTAGGASVSQGGGAITLSGSATQVNAALASLALSAATSGTGTIAITAASGGTTLSSSVAVRALPDSPPAFVAPPAALTLAAGSAQTLGLAIADDPASLLAGFGLGGETLTVSLIADTGAFLLDAASVAAIGVAGNGTGTLVLSAAASDLAGLASALDAVRFAATAAGTLEYVLRQSGGVLPDAVTNCGLSIAVTGTVAGGSAGWAGGVGDWQSAADWSGGVVPGVGTDVTLGNGAAIGGEGLGAALDVAAGASVGLDGAFGVATATFGSGATVAIDGALSIAGGLVLDAATLVVGGSGTLDAAGITIGADGALVAFGALAAGGLAASGTALLPGGGTLAGALDLASGGVVDFAGTLQADAAALATGFDAISLAAGSTLEGAGLLLAGNFSEPETIVGPGTILAPGPAPLAIAAGSIGGGVDLAIAPGGVLELGTVSPLYGVFNATPVTVGADATISFAPGASTAQDATAYASTLGEQGGVLVLDSPADFAATLAGFAPGDRIVLPGLTSLSVLNVSTTGFEVAGLVAGNTTQSEIITIHAAIPAGVAPVVETDQAGDAVIGLRAATAALTLNDVPAAGASIEAVNGVATPLIGLGLLVPSNGTAGLQLTVSAVHGEIVGAGGTAAASLVLSAATALAMNAELAALVYTAPGGGTGDVLNFAGGTGLAGLSAAIGIALAAPGTLDFSGTDGSLFNAGSSWRGGVPPANGDLVVFASHAGAPLLVVGPGAASSASVAGGYDFTGTIDLPSTGAALDIGAGGIALFDAGAVVTLGGGAMVGDAAGAGTLGVAGRLDAAGTIAIAGSAAAGSRLDVSGSIAAAALVLGSGAAGTFDLTGAAAFGAATIDGFGAVTAVGTAALGFGTFTLAGGTVGLAGDASLTLGPATIAAGALQLAGSARLSGTAGLDLAGGTLAIGGLAAASLGGALVLGGGAALAVGGTLDAASLLDSGAATLAGGTLALAGAATLAAGAALTLEGGALRAAAISLAAGATLTGYGLIGTIGAPGLIPVDAAGTLEASGGTLALGGTLAGGATIAAGAVLDLAGPATGGSIAFAGADGTLAINDVAAMTDPVVNMASGDAIDLIGVAPSLVSDAGGTLTVSGQGGFGLAEAAAQAAIAIGTDGFGGTYVTVGGAMPCFARGTRLLTADGYRPVETLRPGHRLVTEGGGTEPIVWIGSRTIDLSRDEAAPLLHPVIITPGAFGPGVPACAVTLSPLHAVLAGDGLVPASLLVNGATVLRDCSRFAVTYYHVELARHAVIRAENLPCETYRDDGNRDRFAVALGVPGAPASSCRPVVTSGAALLAVRAMLHCRAIELGYQIVHGAQVDARAGDAPPILPRCRRGRLDFILLAPVSRLVLRARATPPAYTDPASEDRRSLGICAAGVVANGVRLPAWHGVGWFSPDEGDRGMWSGGAAELVFARPARRVSLDLVGSVPRWVRNPAMLAL